MTKTLKRAREKRDDVQRLVDAGELEQATGAESDLWLGVLKAIAANEARDAQALAFIAVSTLDIEFTRYGR